MQLQIMVALFVTLAASAPNPQNGYPPEGVNRRDVTEKKPCTANILLYARSHTEMGNVGGPIGQSFINATETLAPGRFLYQGFDFGLPVPHLDQSNVWSNVIKRQLKDAVTLCTSARIFLGGWSEGARLLHPALATTDVDKSKIGGIVTFGDPLIKQPFVGIDASKVKHFCAVGDEVCSGLYPYPPIRPAHLFYFRGDTALGAQFVAGLAA